MPRIAPVDTANPPADAKPLVDTVKSAFGGVPNMLATLAQSPAGLEFFLTGKQVLSKGKLGDKLGEQLALAIAGVNACGYCASAHTVIGSKAGIDKAEAERNVAGEASDPRAQAAIDFAKALVVSRGNATDDDLSKVRAAGFDDGEIAEIVAHVAFNSFTNYFNHVADPEIDFPVVNVGEPVFA